jgi:hypothetical protein
MVVKESNWAVVVHLREYLGFAIRQLELGISVARFC